MFLAFLDHCTEVRFASLLSDGFTTMALINPPEKKPENLTSVQCIGLLFLTYAQFGSCGTVIYFLQYSHPWQLMCLSRTIICLNSATYIAKLNH